MSDVRRPAVAGAFYPDDPDVLARDLDSAYAGSRAGAVERRPKALVVPHAGYMYSGPIAASAYRVMPRDASRVVLLGPSHRVPVDGMALPTWRAFATPLGLVAVDIDLHDRVVGMPGVVVDDTAHVLEHSLEVQLPFLQRALPGFTLLPLAVGRCSADLIADVLDEVWGGDETVIIVSTDLSHYHDHETAVGLDRKTADAVVRGDASAIEDLDACGAYPLRGLLVAAARHGLTAELIDLRTSGDTSGDRSRVVGYGAFALA
jgi:MEMO1 family protein